MERGFSDFFGWSASIIMEGEILGSSAMVVATPSRYL